MKEGTDFEIIKTKDEGGNVIKAQIKMLDKKAIKPKKVDEDDK